MLLFILLFVLLSCVEASLPQYTVGSFTRRLEHALVALTIAMRFRFTTINRTIRKVETHNERGGEYVTFHIQTVKQSLLLLHRMFDLLSASEYTDKRDFVYYLHAELKVTKEAAGTLLDKCLFVISTLCGMPRCILPIVPATKIYMLGRLVVRQENKVIINAKRGFKGTLDNKIAHNLFSDEARKNVHGTILEFK
eukprot:scaffold12251_cov56-Cyclotella_meneghiniana.AAC.3